MLPTRETLHLSDYSYLYDIVVPKDNDLRLLHDQIDFSFIHDALDSTYCQDNGRKAIDPVFMFKLLFLKIKCDLSDADVVDYSLHDMAMKYFLDLMPEDRIIDASSLTVFRREHLKGDDLMQALLGKTVEMALEKGLIKGRDIIVDSTHTLARCSQKSPISALQFRAKEVRAAVHKVADKREVTFNFPEKYEGDDMKKEMEYAKGLAAAVENDGNVDSKAVRERVNMLKETIDDIEDHYTVSRDPDARVGHKTADTDFFGYKTHIAMTPEGIITAAKVTSGDADDGKQLPELITASKKLLPKLKYVIGDGAYSQTYNLENAKKEKVRIVSKLVHVEGDRQNNEGLDFTYNKDAGMYVCPTGHMATRKTIRKAEGRSDREVYYFDVLKCCACKLNGICHKKGANSKTYSVTVPPDAKIKQAEFENTKFFQNKYKKQRWKIEQKNSDLKNHLGYSVAESYGLHAMEIQGAMTLFVANIRRIMVLTNQKEVENTEK